MGTLREEYDALDLSSANLRFMVNRARYHKHALAPLCLWASVQMVKCVSWVFRVTSVLVGRLSERR